MTTPIDNTALDEPVVDTRLVPPSRTRLRFTRPLQVTIGWPEVYGGIILALVLVARFIPLARWLPTWGCKFRELSGLPCFSCGMTRSFDWFARGRFLDAFLINPMGFLLACTGAILAIYLVAAPLRLPRPLLELTPHGALALRVTAICACLLNWVYLLIRTRYTGV